MEESSLYISAIRRALANGNAAVMVGAGFSLNAEGGQQLKQWPALGRELWLALNPGSSDSSGFAPAMTNYLAEQYARVFSTAMLEEFLKQHLPDDRVVPGALHEALLNLPWAEIFTTNYDTLLERAADKILDRAHFTVCCREDIPQSKIMNRRRIVKLHGSFPSHRPFIFTEEDYRCYPQRFAPFVNLVRQSLLENVFCLIGFSGEDPNFLHWIGWVRDVLDRHALPIYLFMGAEPTAGVRKVLEARRVTPVILPRPAGVEESDFAARLEELFRLLAEPLEQVAKEWGRLPWAAQVERGTDGPAERFERSLGAVARLAELRRTYPGWLVAPHQVRRTLRRTVESLLIPFEAQWWIDELAKQPLAVSTVILAEYAWLQQTLLQPLEDKTAEFGLRILNQTIAQLQRSQLAGRLDPLKRFGIVNEQDFEVSWRTLALSLMRWSREAMRRDFDQVVMLIRQRLPVDGEVADEIQYESVLRRLYRGERHEARSALSAWRVDSDTPYTLAKKGALLAELGDTETALSLCAEAIQTLRQRQRIRPKATDLSSQEAWACLIASWIRRVHDFSLRTELASDKSQFKDLLSRRLVDLAAQGFNVEAELDSAIAALAAEASPPSEPARQLGEFDLGRTRSFQRLGGPSELIDKILAAHSWLALTERVGFPPRMGQVMVLADSFTCAAWWVQYVDAPARMLGIALRTMSTEILKPKDEALPLHKTGWFSRYQVARLDTTLATETCERALQQAETALATGIDTERVCQFYVELFSRLVLRVRNTEAAVSYAERVLALHRGPALHAQPHLWGVFARALARSFETVPRTARGRLMQLVAELPLVPDMHVDEHFLRDWVRVLDLSTAFDATSESSLPLGVAVSLIESLRSMRRESKDSPALRSLWSRLLWLDQCGALSDSQRIEIGELLWEGAIGWPHVPGHLPPATQVWPPPDPVQAAAAFREWILHARIEPFRDRSAIERISWRLHDDNSFFTDWLVSLREAPWPAEECLLGVQKILNWWDVESSDLKRGIERSDELRRELRERVELIDRLLARRDVYFTVRDSGNAEIVRRLDAMIDGVAAMGGMFWRTRIRRALRAKGSGEIADVERELAQAILSPAHVLKLASVCDVLLLWIEDVQTANVNPPTLLIDAVISVATTRAMPALEWALDVLSRAVKISPATILRGDRTTQLDLALETLLRELDYAERPAGSGVPDDNVPLLRFLCARLSSVLVEVGSGAAGSSARQWLEAAASDPLPEMYLNEYVLTAD